MWVAEVVAVRHVAGILSLVLVWAVPARVCAQTEPEVAPDEGQAWAQMGRLGEELKKLGDWDLQADRITQTVEDVWARNQWNGEADLFARGMVTEIARIPPWQFDRRIDRMVEMVGDRYEFSDPARARFKGSIYRETLGGVWNHAGVLFDQTSEMVGMMVRGEPFTPELVAEWTRRSAPFMEEMRQRSAKIVEDFSGTIDERHRAQFQRDLESLDRRMAYLDGQREAWAQGKWKPEDWGLGNDPAYRGRPDRRSDRARAEKLRLLTGRAVAHDPNTWQWYVRGFIGVYHLDPGQTATAESILTELVSRATDYVRPRAEHLAKVPRQQRATDEAYAPIRALFEELKTRLDRIPTAGQRAGDAG